MNDRNSITDEFLEGIGRRCAAEGKDARETLTSALELVEGLPSSKRRDLDVGAVVATVLAGWDRARQAPAPASSTRMQRWSAPVAAAAAVGALVAAAAALVAGLGGSPPPAAEVAGVTASSGESVTPASTDLADPPATSAVEAGSEPATPTITEPTTADRTPSQPASPTVAAEERPNQVTVIAVNVDRSTAVDQLPDDVTPGAIFSAEALPEEFPEQTPVFVVADGDVPLSVCAFLAEVDDVTFVGDTEGCSAIG